MSGETWRIVVPREVTRVVKIPTGLPGSDGKSAYQLALSEGFEGTESEWLASLRGVPGDDGDNGLSAYEIARALGFAGTEQEWLDSLVGDPGTSAEIVGVSASQLPAGSSPTVSMGGTPEQRTLSFGIPAGAPGSKGDPGDVPGWIIRGAGRPDVPASLSTETAAAVASATSGAEFVSVDGAGVGAWVWRKHGTSWVVTDGDTGWSDVTALATFGSGVVDAGRLLIRRWNGTVLVEADNLHVTENYNTQILALPPGYRGSAIQGGGNRVTAHKAMPYNSNGDNEPSTNLRLNAQNFLSGRAATSRVMFGLFEFPGDATWPITRLGTPT